MPNPFPGVDPFVEASGRWVGFHNVLIGHCSELLNAHLPQNYAAIVEERVELVDMANDPPRLQRRPDVGIIRDRNIVEPEGVAVAVLPEIEPATVTLPVYEEIREAYIDIISLPGRELITAIEILSPANKNKADGGDYLAKRLALIHRGINLVEIDLLLGGDRLPAREPLPGGDFYAFISRRERRPKCEVYAWSIRRALPRLPIPLKSPDKDVFLDLAEAFRLTYDGGRYDRTLRYDVPIGGSLPQVERGWVAERIATKNHVDSDA